MNNFTYHDAQKMIQAITVLLNESGAFMDKNKNKYLLHSQAKKEVTAFKNSESVETAFSQGNILIEFTGDHLDALTKLLSEPVNSIATWTCTRTILESSAISSWLLDPKIDVIERVERSFAFRYEGLNQQLKFNNSQNLQDYKSSIEKRIDEVENKALSLGYSTIYNKKKKRIGIGQQMPSITHLVGSILGDEASYRLLSSLTHAHPWALQQTSFRVQSKNNHPYLERNLDINSVVYLCTIGIKSFSRSIWYVTLLFGWDEKKMKQLLQTVFDVIKIPNEERIWNSI